MSDSAVLQLEHQHSVVYALHGPDGSYRYVGMTRQDPRRRLAQHRRNPPRLAHLPVSQWISLIGPTSIAMTILQIDCADLGEAEKVWIERLRGEGMQLLNMTAGGQRGAVGYRHSDEERARRALRTLGNSNARGVVRSPEYRERMSQSLSGRRCPEGCTCGRHTVNAGRGLRISEALRAKRQITDPVSLP